MTIYKSEPNIFPVNYKRNPEPWAFDFFCNAPGQTFVNSPSPPRTRLWLRFSVF